MPDEDSEGATRIVLPGTDIADGVRVGDGGNYFPWIEEEPEVEYTDPDDGPFPWGMLVWFVLLAMAAVALGALVSGR